MVEGRGVTRTYAVRQPRTIWIVLFGVPVLFMSIRTLQTADSSVRAIAASVFMGVGSIWLMGLYVRDLLAGEEGIELSDSSFRSLRAGAPWTDGSAVHALRHERLRHRVVLLDDEGCRLAALPYGREGFDEAIAAVIDLCPAAAHPRSLPATFRAGWSGHVVGAVLVALAAWFIVWLAPQVAEQGISVLLEYRNAVSLFVIGVAVWGWLRQLKAVTVDADGITLRFLGRSTHFARDDIRAVGIQTSDSRVFDRVYFTTAASILFVAGGSTSIEPGAVDTFELYYTVRAMLERG